MTTCVLITQGSYVEIGNAILAVIWLEEKNHMDLC
jgi:hypothetical protein